MYTIGITTATHLLDKIFAPLTTNRSSYFYQLVGLADESSYNDTLALLNHRLSDAKRGILFSDAIPKPSDKSLIDSILQELRVMTIGAYVKEQIDLTSSSHLNLQIRQALDTVIAQAITQEHFSNETIRNNFIAKLMIWCSTYIEPLDFQQDTPPKCVFYGPIKRHEVYFLLLLNQIGVDIIYLNPTGDATLEALDLSHVCEKHILGATSVTLEPFIERASKGVAIEKVTTYAKKATHELEQTLYNETGIYKPWQFASGTTHPIVMDSVIEDLLTYWNESAKLRPGFKTSGKTVYTPCFFTKISGAYGDINQYYELIDKLKTAKNYILYPTPHLTGVGFGQSRTIQYHNTPTQSSTQNPSSYNQQDLYSLAFCLNPDQTIKRDAIKQHILYKKFLTLRGDFQEFLLTKLEETFATSNQAFFNFTITDKERVRLMAALFTAEDRLLNLLEGYDFTGDIPKIILYINSRETFNQDDALLLGLLRHIGIDILLLSPNGANNIELMISDKFINTVVLEQFVYDLPLEAKTKKNSFFSKLFR